MDIKKIIGQRIKAERLAKGLTRKALVKLTDNLKETRICNWELGNRTPGVDEIKQLAQALDVSPAYLMCLTDKKHVEQIPGLGKLLPLLNYLQACDPDVALQVIKNEQPQDEITFIPISSEYSANLGENAFAIKMKDESMHPELRINDTLIVDQQTLFYPGSIVVAQIEGSKKEVIVRRYKQLDLSKEFKPFELRAENDNWGNIKISKMNEGKIIGTVVGIVRYMGK